jgi:hypothetical protein
MPGIKVFEVPSIVVAPAGTVTCAVGPTVAIFLWSMRTVCLVSTLVPVPSITSTFEIAIMAARVLMNGETVSPDCAAAVPAKHTAVRIVMNHLYIEPSVRPGSCPSRNLHAGSVCIFPGFIPKRSAKVH